MDRRPYDAQRALAARAIARAAEIARGYFGHVAGTIKPDDPTQVVTAADLAVGQELVDAVRTAYPDHNVVDEEAGVVDRGSAWTWVVDPVDGTSNFAAGIPLYAILLGLLHNGAPGRRRDGAAGQRRRLHGRARPDRARPRRGARPGVARAATRRSSPVADRGTPTIVRGVSL